MTDTKREDIEELLARSRKLVAESRQLMEQVELRQAETDRLLKAQGLTRETVLQMRFTPEQKLAVNEELKRRGLPTIEEDDGAYDFDAATAEFREGQSSAGEGAFADGAATDDIVADRQRKFGNFMQEIRL